MPVVLGVASAITSRRIATYGVVSTIAAIAIVLNAFRQRSNFYSAAVMLGGSNGCMMVLFNFGVFLTLCAGKIAQKIFFGPLRAVEVERLHERLWYAITESLLAMTIFRDDFDGSFALLFGTMLFLKVFHWLARDRVEFMEQSPSVSRLFHVRMIAVLSLLFEFDLFFATFAIEVLLIDQNRKGIMIMFASEFFILTATLWATIAKYLINCQDMRSEEPWEAKSMYVFFVDLATDFLKLVTYLGCFGLILSYYGLPLNIIRDVYMTGRSFFGRLRDFIKYRAATRNMDTRFPDATTTDLSSMSDGTCIICREEMVARGAARDDAASGEAQPPAASGLNETPKKLPCGHIFHFHCLRSWLERQQSCPTCRRTVFTAPDATAAGATQQANAAPPNAGANAAAAGAQANAGMPRPAAGAAEPRTAAEIAQAAQERMEHLLQQLDASSQRLRALRPQGDGLQAPNPTLPNLATASGSRQVPPTEADSSLEQRRKRMITAIFGRHDELDRGTSGLQGPSAPASTSSVRREEKDAKRTQHSQEKRVLSHIPAAPWTLHSALRSSNAPQRDRADTRTSTTPERQASASGTNEQCAPSNTTASSAPSADEEASTDPADAREAARLAALRRFQKERATNPKGEAAPAEDRTAAPTLTPTASASTAIEESNTPVALPGNPVLIPLFQPELIADFDNTVASRLPFPLAGRQQLPGATQTALQNNQGTPAPAPAMRPMSTLAHTARGIEGLDAISPLSLSATDLTQLSSQTRQGLESRLQLLHRVEGSIHGLIEDLTRALSVMPPNDDVAPLETEQEGSAAVAPSSPTRHAQDKPVVTARLSDAKGKTPAEGLNALELDSRETDADQGDGA